MLVLPLVLAGMVALAGCGKNPSTGSTSTSTGGNGNAGGCTTTQTIGMDPTKFANNGGCVQVTKGQPVTFDDTVSGGGVHIICTGPDSGAYSATCVANSNAPTQLQGAGTTTQPGSKTQITFDNAGTYNVICTVHPDMQITVKVQ